MPAPTGPDTLERYGRAAMRLHWLSAILLVVVATLGLLHDSWSRSTQATWINRHAVLGLLLLALVVARLGVRRASPPPPLPPAAGGLARRLAAPVHALLYLLLLAIPALGIVTFIWHGRAFDFGVVRLDPGVHADRSIFHPTEEWHGDLAYVLFALVGLHVLAGVWHQVVRRDRMLERMWPPRRARE